MIDEKTMKDIIKTVYYIVIVSAFEQKTYEINDYRVERRRDFMITIIYDAFNYTDGLLVV